MTDDCSKKLADRQRDVMAGRFGKPGGGNPYTLHYQEGARLGGRDPRTGQLLNNATGSTSSSSTHSPVVASVSPSAAIGGLLAILAIGGYFVFQGFENMQRAEKERARVAPAVAPTHFVSNEDAQYYYAAGARKGKEARSNIVKPGLGKCYDLSANRQGAETVTIDLATYSGQVFRMYTNSANFSALPEGASCKYGYFSRP